MDNNVLDYSLGQVLQVQNVCQEEQINVFLQIKARKVWLQLSSNIKKARVENESITLNTDFKSAVLSLGRQGEKFTIIFMDPPYYKNMFIDALSSVDENNLLEEDGIIVVEHEYKRQLPRQCWKTI